MPTTIENGTISKGGGVYEYINTTNAGTEKITFVSATIPEIGDVIGDDLVLIPLQGYKVNNDTSKWEHHDRETWGRD